MNKANTLFCRVCSFPNMKEEKFSSLAIWKAGHDSALDYYYYDLAGAVFRISKRNADGSTYSEYATLTTDEYGYAELDGLAYIYIRLRLRPVGLRLDDRGDLHGQSMSRNTSGLITTTINQCPFSQGFLYRKGDQHGASGRTVARL